MTSAPTESIKVMGAQSTMMVWRFRWRGSSASSATQLTTLNWLYACELCGNDSSSISAKWRDDGWDSVSDKSPLSMESELRFRFGLWRYCTEDGSSSLSSAAKALSTLLFGGSTVMVTWEWKDKGNTSCYSTHTVHCMLQYTHMYICMHTHTVHCTLYVCYSTHTVHCVLQYTHMYICMHTHTVHCTYITVHTYVCVYAHTHWVFCMSIRSTLHFTCRHWCGNSNSSVWQQTDTQQTCSCLLSSLDDPDPSSSIPWESFGLVSSSLNRLYLTVDGLPMNCRKKSFQWGLGQQSVQPGQPAASNWAHTSQPSTPLHCTHHLTTAHTYVCMYTIVNTVHCKTSLEKHVSICDQMRRFTPTLYVLTYIRTYIKIGIHVQYIHIILCFSPLVPLSYDVHTLWQLSANFFSEWGNWRLELKVSWIVWM